MMEISDMISQLKFIEQKFGDIPVGFFDDLNKELKKVFSNA